MNVETKIWLALKLDFTSQLRKAAAIAAYHYWMEMHRYGEFSANTKALTRLVKRFKLGDWVCALSAHYPIKSYV